MKKIFIAYLFFLLFIVFGFFSYWGGLKANSWRFKTSNSYFRKGEEELKVENYKKAFLNFQKAEVLKPFSEDIQLEIGNLYYSLGFFDKAKEYYLNTDSYQGYARLAQCYFEEKNYKKVEDFANKSIDIQENQEAFHILSLSFIAQEKFNNAKSILKKAISYEKTDEKSYYYNSLILALDDLESAEGEAKSAQNNSDAQEFLEVLTEIKTHPDSHYRKVLLVNFYIEKKFYSLSAYLLDQIIQEKDDYRDAYFLLGKTYFLDKNYDKAKESLKKAIEIDHIYKEGYLLLAEVYKKLGDSKESDKNLEKANGLTL